ncbi:hypothetical protein GUJ93_ZPchr0009g384 [Zizania palustris]|uniref:Uncharacterized protein n=1 Tax=Zizania palustris TaxID=103762 RepID=A0A8J5R8J2_ZIZPA|nr:hypothetical protein GUJ93_ZPchr0009g384 [Zizania palustris]
MAAGDGGDPQRGMEGRALALSQFRVRVVGSPFLLSVDSGAARGSSGASGRGRVARITTEAYPSRAGRGRAWKRDSPEASSRRAGTTRVPKLSPEVSSQRTGRTKVPSVNLEVSHHRAVAAVRLLRIEKGKAFVGILLHQFHFVQEGLHLVGYHYEMALLRSEEKISLGAAE